MSGKYEIYQITLPTGETYYGQHYNPLYPNDDGYMGSGTTLLAYYKEHGKESVKKEILTAFDTKSECDISERETIKENRGLFNLNRLHTGFYKPKGKLKRGEESAKLTCSIPMPLKMALEKKALEERRSLNDQIVFLLESALKTNLPAQN